MKTETIANGLANEKYGLTFLSDNDLFEHVQETIKKYKFCCSLEKLTENILDPIKLTFDAKVYKKSTQ